MDWRTRWLAKLAAWDASAGDGRAALGMFFDELDAQADSVARHGCPIGTLASDLARSDDAERGSAAELFEILLEWLSRNLAASGATRDAPERAEALLALAQGGARLAHVFRDPERMRRQVALMRRDSFGEKGLP
ncbi:LmrA/YxaF family transcription factor [Congregicoccus parvus]|uniref:LmrA/YxaF family transcription factor n=1 Tax=Congregicoccus parvus TaxID=3081749 RepID=UPI003FA59A50